MGKYLSVILIFLLLLSGCSNAAKTKGGSENTNPKKLQIVTTFYPMYYFTKQVAGDVASVNLLIPSGVEPHDWDPTAKDIARIQDSDVFIFNSTYFETWTEKVFKSIDTSKLKVVEASKGIELIDSDEDHHHTDHHVSKDPHVWLSPVLAAKEVANIAEALEEVDPGNKEQYEKNAEAITAKLADLDQLYRGTIDKAQRTDFVTQHAAFGYLAKQYGLTQIPIAGLSPDAEPTLGKLAELAKLTKENNVKIVYFEGLTSSKVAQTLANEIGADTEVLNPLEGLTKEEEEQGLDYIGVMEKNLAALKMSLYNSK
ncbi:metal ABC transporter substrate-binding protein [Peribacillus loiseleuriae]|uniref:metal ABC transporter substrate-binding protein n=1 Tax=Peribacillus loiseleuriae TaxID=1679170 RepID=UPI003816E274